LRISGFENEIVIKGRKKQHKEKLNILYLFKTKWILVDIVPLCIVYSQGVISTDKHNSADLIHWS